MEDITRAAGAANGTCYLYFSSWNNLLLAVRHHLESTFIAEVRARLASNPTMSLSVVVAEPAAPLVFSVLHTTADSIIKTGRREEKLPTALGLLRNWLQA